MAIRSIPLNDITVRTPLNEVSVSKGNPFQGLLYNNLPILWTVQGVGRLIEYRRSTELQEIRVIKGGAEGRIRVVEVYTSGENAIIEFDSNNVYTCDLTLQKAGFRTKLRDVYPGIMSTIAKVYLAETIIQPSNHATPPTRKRPWTRSQPAENGTGS